MCRAAKIKKVGPSGLDGVIVSITVHKINKHSRKPTELKKKVSDIQKHKQCKYCGKYMYHETKREKCPAYEQTCRKCNKLNQFKNKCTTSSKHGPTVKKKVNTVYFGDNSSNCKTAHVTMLIQGQKVQFQLRLISYLKNTCVTCLPNVQLTTSSVTD